MNGWNTVTGWRCSTTDSGVTCLIYALKQDGTAEQQLFKWRIYTVENLEDSDGQYFESIADS